MSAISFADELQRPTGFDTVSGFRESQCPIKLELAEPVIAGWNENPLSVPNLQSLAPSG